ncbi:hypothetical protein BC827DRAFT_1169406 [Russula dissimulans]|nr:hypothetical protein BC827DRAFT_1169406 [Russula dissimulans]
MSFQVVHHLKTWTTTSIHSQATCQCPFKLPSISPLSFPSCCFTFAQPLGYYLFFLPYFPQSSISPTHISHSNSCFKAVCPILRPCGPHHTPVLTPTLYHPSCF